MVTINIVYNDDSPGHFHVSPIKGWKITVLKGVSFISIGTETGRQMIPLQNVKILEVVITEED